MIGNSSNIVTVFASQPVVFALKIVPSEIGNRMPASRIVINTPITFSSIPILQLTPYAIEVISMEIFKCYYLYVIQNTDKSLIMTISIT